MWGVLFGSERLLKFLGSFLTFWGFWGNPQCSHVFRVVVKGWCTLRGTLWHYWCNMKSSEALTLVWAILNGCWRLTGVFCSSLEFWDVIVVSEWFWKVAESSETFLDSLGCYGMLWGVLRYSVCSERFWNDSKSSETFSGFLECCGVLIHCHGLYVLWMVFELSQVFFWIFSTSERLLRYWRVVWGVLQHSAAFWDVPMGSK